MKYLISTVENYRVDSEEEVQELIEEAKADGKFALTKYTSTYKERKQKGEVIDSYWKVSLTKHFTDEKEPDFGTTVIYEQD